MSENPVRKAKTATEEGIWWSMLPIGILLYAASVCPHLWMSIVCAFIAGMITMIQIERWNRGR